VIAVTAKAISRFRKHVHEEPMSGCYLWLAWTDRDGYGLFADAEWHHRRAHAFAFVAATGSQVPPSMVLDHLCNMPSCVNPRHLRVCTQRENVLRGRGTAAANARKTTCPRCGGAYRPRRGGGRRCYPCEQRRKAEVRAERTPETLERLRVKWRARYYRDKAARKRQVKEARRA
jgi:hypothetical protein